MENTLIRTGYNNLPRHLVDFLGQKGDITAHIADYQKTSNISEINATINKTLTEIILYYDSIGLDCRINNLGRFIRDPLENANMHSESSYPTRFGIYLSEKGFIASYHDDGDFFKNQKVKQSYEKREIYREKNKIGEIGQGNSNPQFIYDYADKIYVDISEGTLYVGLGIGKVISSHWEKFKPEDTKKEENTKVPIKGKNPKHQRNSKSQKVRQ